MPALEAALPCLRGSRCLLAGTLDSPLTAGPRVGGVGTSFQAAGGQARCFSYLEAALRALVSALSVKTGNFLKRGKSSQHPPTPELVLGGGLEDIPRTSGELGVVFACLALSPLSWPSHAFTAHLV